MVQVLQQVQHQPQQLHPSASGTAYGLVGGYTNFSAIINGGSGNTTVNFTTNTQGRPFMDKQLLFQKTWQLTLMPQVFLI